MVNNVGQASPQIVKPCLEIENDPASDGLEPVHGDGSSLTLTATR